MPTTTATDEFTTGQLAVLFGVRYWQVQRLFALGRMPPHRRIGAYRVLNADQLPAAEAALRAAGYLAAAVVEAGATCA